MKFVPKDPIKNKSNVDLIHWCICAALGGDVLKFEDPLQKLCKHAYGKQVIPSGSQRIWIWNKTIYDI